MNFTVYKIRRKSDGLFAGRSRWGKRGRTFSQRGHATTSIKYGAWTDPDGSISYRGTPIADIEIVEYGATEARCFTLSGDTKRSLKVEEVGK